MITTSTDVSVVAAQLAGWSLLVRLGDMEAVITAAPLMAIVGVGTAYLVVALVTNVRAGIEEKMLEERYPEYAEYRSRTKRYIPFVV
ncbi:MAG: hypothetical protein ACC647_10640 [Anaerolineales bacterium]